MVDAKLKVVIAGESKALEAEIKRTEALIASLKAKMIGLGEGGKGFDALKVKVAESEKALLNMKGATDSLGGNTAKLGSVIAGLINPLTIASAGAIAFGAAASRSVQDFAQLESVLNRVRVFSGQTKESFASIESGVNSLSAEFGRFKQVEIASSLEDLVKSGVPAADALGLVRTSMQASIASGEDLKTVNGEILDSLFQFQLGFDQSGRVADVFANTANATKLSVNDIAQSMRNTGSVANQFGVDIETTAAAIGVLGQNGTVGVRAGEQLKIVLRNLFAPVGQASDALKELGVTTYDVATGKARPLQDVLVDLKKALSQLSPEQANTTATLLAGGEAMGSFTQLVRASDGQLQEFTKSNQNAQGANARLASEMDQGLSVAFQKFSNQLGIASINLGKTISDVLKLEAALRNLANALGAYNKLQATVGNQGFASRIKNSDVNAALGLEVQGLAKRNDKGQFQITPQGKSSFFGLQAPGIQKQLDIANKKTEVLLNAKISKLDDAEVLKSLNVAQSQINQSTKKKPLNLPVNVGPPSSVGGGGGVASTGKGGGGSKNSDNSSEREQALALKRAEQTAKELQQQQEKTAELGRQLEFQRQEIALKAQAEQDKAGIENLKQANEFKQQELQSQRQLIEAKKQAGLLTDEEAKKQLDQNQLDQIKLQTASQQLGIQQQISSQKEQLQQKELETQNKIAQIQADQNLTEEQKLLKIQLVSEAYKAFELGVNNTLLGLQASNLSLGQMGKELIDFTLLIQALPPKVDDLNDSCNQTADSMNVLQNAAQGIGNSLTNAFQNGKFEAKKFGQEVINVLLNIAKQLLISGIGKFLGGVGGGIGGGGGGFSFGGFRAAGGPVGAGSSYVVGEQGPELFTPSTSGSIIPNNALRGFANGQGGSSVGVVNISITAMDSQDVIRAISKPEVKQVIGRLSAQTVQTLSNKSFNNSPMERQRQ